jgi:hypothetical protein
MAREPALTQEQAESLVQGEEHRLLVRHGKPALAEPGRGRLIAKVAKAASFERALEIIADTIGE